VVAFTVSDFHDLVRLLEERPEWRAELQRVLLGDRLLRLPELVQELVEAQRRTAEQVAALAEAQRRTEELLQALTRRVDGIDGGLDKMDARFDGIDGRLDRMDVRFDGIDQRLDTMDARFDGVDQRFDGIDGRLDGIEGRLGRVEADVGSIKVDVGSIKVDVGSIKAEMGGMRGQLLETRYRDRAGAYFSRVLGRVRLLSQRELDVLLERAIDAGTLDNEAAREIRLADLIIRGRRLEDGAEAYLAVEVSAGIGPDDVERALHRAALLSRLGPALPVVAGERISSEVAALARERGVWQVLDGRVVDPAAA
jgi:archaellum component FlaC